MTRERLNAESLAYMKESAHRALPTPPSFVDHLAAEVAACWEERERLTAVAEAARELIYRGSGAARWSKLQRTLAEVDALREPQEDAR